MLRQKLIAAALVAALSPFARLPSFAAAEEQPSARYVTQSVRGQVVFAGDAMRRLFGISVVPEATERLLVLETAEGELVPLVEDVRGRAFRGDKRLRNIDVELLVRRYEGSPLVQVIRVYEGTGKSKFELDYWCEICAIAMFELKACDCCQGPIELRRRKVSGP
jgi:hypothetical protein